MNDFTKEELELTLSLYQEFMKKYEFTEDVEDITQKLQSMIDNYCDHNLAVYIGPNGTKVSCQKCKKEFQ